MGMNTSRGIGGGKYADLAALLLNSDNAIKDGDLLFTADTGASYQATETQESGAQIIANTAPVLYANARSGFALTEPDLFIPFNEGGEIERGFGNRDAFGNRAVDFSRASVSGCVNKSGVVDDIAIDELCIGSDGVSIYEVTNNLFNYSEDFSQWLSLRVTLESNVDAPDGTINAYKIISTTENNTHSLNLGAITIVNTEMYTKSVHAKATGSGSLERYLLLESDGFSNWVKTGNVVFDLLTGVVVSGTGSLYAGGDYFISELGDGWYRCGIILTSKVDAAIPQEIQHTDSTFNTTFTGDNTSGIEIFGAQFATVNLESPYIKTESTPVSRSPDITSVPMMGNMPATGAPFTDFYDFVYNGSVGFICETQSRGYGVLVDQSGNVRCRGVSTEDSICSGLVKGNKYRLAISFDGTEVTGYLNGDKKSTTTTPDISYDPSELIYIGRSFSGQYLNSYIKNNRRFFSNGALSDAEIKAWGGSE